MVRVSLFCLLIFSIVLPLSRSASGQALPETSQTAATSQQHQLCTAIAAKQQILLTGFTRARAGMDLIPEVAGKCVDLYADVGEVIADNGIFASVDATMVELDLQANALSQQQTRSTLRFNTTQVKRYRQLHTSKSSSQARLDEQELELEQSRIKLEQLQVEEQRLRELLARHRIKAPPGWRIIERQVEPGQWLRSGQVIARAGDFQQLIVPFAVTRAELRSLQEQGDTIIVHLPFDGKEGRGSLYRISPGFDPVSRKIQVEILLSETTCDNLSLQQGGVQVEVKVEVPDPMHSLLIPASAVLERYEENRLIRSTNQEMRVIVLGNAPGPDNSGRWLRIISPDIKPGDTFLLNPVP